MDTSQLSSGLLSAWSQVANRLKRRIDHPRLAALLPGAAR